MYRERAELRPRRAPAELDRDAAARRDGGFPAADPLYLAALTVGQAVDGLHDSGDRTVVFMYVSGTTGDASFELNTWPVIWIRDSGGWWHATRAGGSADEDREITMDMPVIPPLSRDTDWIEVIASGRSAQAHLVLPVRWQASRPAT